jgi:hypothetical protein
VPGLALATFFYDGQGWALYVDSGEFCVKLHSLKKDGFEYVFVLVYGALQDSHKAEFLAELVRMCEAEPLLMLLVGDFQILYRCEDKNNDNYNSHWPFVCSNCPL